MDKIYYNHFIVSEKSEYHRFDEIFHIGSGSIGKEYKKEARQSRITKTGEVYRSPKAVKKTTATIVFGQPLLDRKALASNPPKRTDLLRADHLIQDERSFKSIPALQRSGVELSQTKLRGLLSDVQGLPAISKNGKVGILYPEDEVFALIDKDEKKKARRKARKETKAKPLDPALWSPTDYFVDVFGMHYTTVRAILMREEVGTTLYGQNIRYFLRAEGTKALTEYLRKKKINGMYFREREARVTLDYLHKRFGLHDSTLRRALGSIGKKDEDSNLTLYPLTDSLARLRPFLETPQVDENGIYTDNDGHRWVIERAAAQILGISVDKLKQYEDGVATKPIRGRGAIPTTGYDFDSLHKRVAPYLAQKRKKKD